MLCCERSPRFGQGRHEKEKRKKRSDGFKGQVPSGPSSLTRLPVWALEPPCEPHALPHPREGLVPFLMTTRALSKP